MDVDEDMSITTRPGKGKGKARAISEGVEEGILHPVLNKGNGKAVATRPFALDKGKGKAIEKSPPKVKLILPPIKITVSKQPPKFGSDSDSELEILQPGHEEKATNSERQKMVEQLRRVRRVKPLVEAQGKPKLTGQELQADLLKKSRLQAAQEREERIEELKAKGIIVLTAEERAREEKQVEDMLEKARKEALAIRKVEKRSEKERGEPDGVTVKK
jgi:mediator of replication checkpoint protein 1